MWHQPLSELWYKALEITIKPTDVPVIGIHGLIGSGKDTIADYLIYRSKYVYTKYAFADPIRGAVKLLFGFSDQQLFDRKLKETVDPYFGFSPRYAIQRLGTEYGRNMLCQDVWLKIARRQIEKNAYHSLKTVISDVRFENEAEFIRSLGGVIVHVKPPIQPYVENTTALHESEAGIPLLPGEALIINDKSKGLEQLYIELDKRFIL